MNDLIAALKPHGLDAVECNDGISLNVWRSGRPTRYPVTTITRRGATYRWGCAFQHSADRSAAAVVVAEQVAESLECEGHESLDGAHMGETVYCDGTCR